MSIFEEIFTTEGRLNRLRYLKYMLIFALFAGTGTFITSSMATFLTGNPTGTLVNIVTACWGIAAAAGNIMLMIRRLHDLGRNGWFSLIALVPFVGAIFSVYLFVAPGQVGRNKYGEDPLTY